jgi:carbamate kinase
MSMDLYRSDRKMVLVALGGNALIRRGEKGDIETQERNADEIVGQLMTLVERDFNLVITHGNGPQVGNLLLRNEKAKDVLPFMPLDLLVAETEGSMGYLVQQSFLNHLRRRAINRYVVTMITQVIIDRHDPAFARPSKPIGLFYSEEEGKELAQQYDWSMIEDAGRGWRRVVPSPRPLKVIQRHMVRHLAIEGNIVIAAGGGGVPIRVDEEGSYEGIEAVIDKDLTSSLLGSEIKADRLIILMPEPKVYAFFGTNRQRSLERLTVSQMKDLMAEGHFPPGNIGPKVEAAVNFVERGGTDAIITNPENLSAALDGNEGTHIVK